MIDRVFIFITFGIFQAYITLLSSQVLASVLFLLWVWYSESCSFSHLSLSAEICYSSLIPNIKWRPGHSKKIKLQNHIHHAIGYEIFNTILANWKSHDKYNAPWLSGFLSQEYLVDLTFLGEKYDPYMKRNNWVKLTKNLTFIYGLQRTYSWYHSWLLNALPLMSAHSKHLFSHYLFHFKANYIVNIWPRNLTRRYLSMINKSLWPNKTMKTDVHSSLIHNNPNLEQSNFLSPHE